MQKGCGIKATGKLKEFAFYPLGWRLDQSQDIMFPPAVFRERELLYPIVDRHAALVRKLGVRVTLPEGGVGEPANRWGVIWRSLQLSALWPGGTKFP